MKLVRLNEEKEIIAEAELIGGGTKITVSEGAIRVMLLYPDNPLFNRVDFELFRLQSTKMEDLIKMQKLLAVIGPLSIITINHDCTVDIYNSNRGFELEVEFALPVINITSPEYNIKNLELPNWGIVPEK